MKRRVKRLVLAKETVAVLGVQEMTGVAGGITAGMISTCRKVCETNIDCSHSCDTRCVN
jgi:hypothetical protein